MDEFSIAVYPNPMQEFVTVKSADYFMTQLSLLDINGRVVKFVVVNNTSYQLNVIDLPSGSYHLIIKTQEQNFNVRLIK